MSITRKSLAHLAMVAAGGLSLSACATTDYVDEQIALVNTRIDGVEANLATTTTTANAAAARQTRRTPTGASTADRSRRPARAGGSGAAATAELIARVRRPDPRHGLESLRPIGYRCIVVTEAG